MSDQRSRYIVEVVGLDQLRQWTAEQANLEKRALAVERALLQTAAASERYDAASKQSALATARISTEMARATEIADRMATADQRLSLETERLRQGSERLVIEQERLRMSQEKLASGNLETRMKAQREVAGALGNGIANVAAGFVGVGLASAKMAADVERDFLTVRNNTTMTASEYAQMKSAVLEMSAATGTSFKDLGEAFMHIANFGYSGADAVKLLNVANMAAVATGSSAATTAQLLAKIMRENGIETGKAAETMNVLWYAAGNSDAKMSQLIETGGRAFAMASKLGFGFNETAAMMSTFMGMGLKASDATTQLIGVMNKMTTPTAAVEKELAAVSKRTGIDLVSDFSLAGVKAKQFSGVFDDVRAAATKMGIPFEQLAKDLFPNLRGTIGALIGTSDAGITGLYHRLNDIADLQAGKSDPTQAAFNERMKSADQQFKALVQTLQAEFLPIGQKFIGLMNDAIPVVKEAAETVAKMMDWFLKLPRPIQDGVLALGAFRLATIALGNPLAGLGGLIKNLIILFRGVPAAAAEAEAGIAGVSAAAGGGGFAGGARALIGRAAGSGLGAAAIAVGATAGVMGFVQHEMWNGVQMAPGGNVGYTPGPTNIDPRTGRVIQPQYGPPTSMARSIFQTYPNFVKGNSSGNPATDAANLSAYNQMKAASGKRGGGSDHDDEADKADKLAQLNKSITDELYGLNTPNDFQRQRHDAVQKAHDWATQEGATATTRSLAHQWLGKSLSSIDDAQSNDIRTKQIDAIRSFQQNKQLPYEQSRGMNSLDPATRSSAFDAMANYNQARRDDEDEFNSRAAADRAKAKQDKLDAQRAVDEATDHQITQLGRTNRFTLQDMGSFYPNTPEGKLNTAVWERMQQQGYVSQLQGIQAKGGLSQDVQDHLTDALQQAKAELDKLNATIKELSGKMGDKALTPDQRAQQTTNDVIRGMQTGQTAGAAIGGLFGRNGAGIGGGIGAGLSGLASGFGDTKLSGYIGIAGQAAGVFANGQQNGPVAGTISGAGQGATIGAGLGGPAGAAIGAGVGGLLGLFGGLFGGHHHRDTTQRDTNPALGNAPSGFDEDAYRFRVTGQLPTSTQLGLNLANGNQPIQTITVSLDGVKAAIATQVNGATTTAAASLQNSFPNLARPL